MNANFMHLLSVLSKYNPKTQHKTIHSAGYRVFLTFYNAGYWECSVITSQIKLDFLYGSGIRKADLLKLRVKDIDFTSKIVSVFRGKSGKDRKGGTDKAAMFPSNLMASLKSQIDEVRQISSNRHAGGGGETSLPAGLARKYPYAIKKFKWQYLFPSTHRCQHPVVGYYCRHHLRCSALTKASKKQLLRQWLQSMWLHIRLDIPLPHNCCFQVQISELYKSYQAITTWEPLKFTLTLLANILLEQQACEIGTPSADGYRLSPLNKSSFRICFMTIRSFLSLGIISLTAASRTMRPILEPY